MVETPVRATLVTFGRSGRTFVVMREVILPLAKDATSRRHGLAVFEPDGAGRGDAVGGASPQSSRGPAVAGGDVRPRLRRITRRYRGFGRSSSEPPTPPGARADHHPGRVVDLHRGAELLSASWIGFGVSVEPPDPEVTEPTPRLVVSCNISD